MIFNKLELNFVSIKHSLKELVHSVFEKVKNVQFQTQTLIFSVDSEKNLMFTTHKLGIIEHEHSNIDIFSYESNLNSYFIKQIDVLKQLVETMTDSQLEKYFNNKTYWYIISFDTYSHKYQNYDYDSIKISKEKFYYVSDKKITTIKSTRLEELSQLLNNLQNSRAFRSWRLQNSNCSDVNLMIKFANKELLFNAENSLEEFLNHNHLTETSTLAQFYKSKIIDLAATFQVEPVQANNIANLVLNKQESNLVFLSQTNKLLEPFIAYLKENIEELKYNWFNPVIDIFINYLKNCLEVLSLINDDSRIKNLSIYLQNNNIDNIEKINYCINQLKTIEKELGHTYHQIIKIKNNIFVCCITFNLVTELQYFLLGYETTKNSILNTLLDECEFNIQNKTINSVNNPIDVAVINTALSQVTKQNKNKRITYKIENKGLFKLIEHYLPNSNNWYLYKKIKLISDKSLEEQIINLLELNTKSLSEICNIIPDVREYKSLLIKELKLAIS